MVEEDAVTGENIVSFAVVNANPIGVKLGAGIRRARIKRRFFRLGNFLHQAVQLGSGGLIKFGAFLHAQNADGLQKAQGAQGIHIGSVFGAVEGNLHMALRREVINFVGLHFLHQADEVGGVGEIAVMQDKAPVFLMRALVEVIDAGGIE